MPVPGSTNNTFYRFYGHHHHGQGVDVGVGVGLVGVLVGSTGVSVDVAVALVVVGVGGAVVMVGVGGAVVAVAVGVSRVIVAVAVGAVVAVFAGVGVGKIVGGNKPTGVPYPGCRKRSLIISACALRVIYGASMFTSGVINGWLKTTSTTTRALGPPGYSVPCTGGSEA